MSASLWTASDPLVLASGSTARRLLLEAAGIPLVVDPADIDERVTEADVRAAGAGPRAVALHLAEAKALAVSGSHHERLVLGGDQVLALGDTLFTKAPTLPAARAQLERLSGQTHSLHSAWAVARGGEIVASGSVEARLTVRQLSSAFLDRYLAAEGAAVLSSVGAYRLEGLGVQLFERIEGDHSTILGLPLLDMLPALRRLGVLLG